MIADLKVTADHDPDTGHRSVSLWREFPGTYRTETLVDCSPAEARELAVRLVAAAKRTEATLRLEQARDQGR